jgi:hypothetical protein
VSPLIVAVRFWARLRNVARLGIDDWLILLSLVGFDLKCWDNTALMACQIFGTACNGILITGKSSPTSIVNLE